MNRIEWKSLAAAFLAVAELAYMRYLKKEYPYLFHLAMRQNPFDEAASAIVE